jgi:transcription antitermination factor NusG
LLKLSENPPAIWPEDKSINEFEGAWWVVHTKSRNEKALAWQMQRAGISYFLPMTKKVTKSKGRTTRSILPLFTGYMFFCGNEDDRLVVLQTNRIANLIEVTEQEAFLRDLSPIELLIKEGENIQPHVYIKAGQKCRVTAGPLLGTEGIAEISTESTKLILQVDMLGQATSVEIATDMIEMIE